MPAHRSRGRSLTARRPEYRLEREYEDVAAVVDAVAAAGTRVDVHGHPHGGIVAFGAATLTSQIRRLVLYEAWPVPDPFVYALPGTSNSGWTSFWPGASAGRTMYVVPYLMAPPGPPLEEYAAGVELTDQRVPSPISRWRRCRCPVPPHNVAA